MKKWRLIVTGSVLMAMMTFFTACGTGNAGNAADETAMKNETKKEDAVEGDLIDKEKEESKDNDNFVDEIMDNTANSDDNTNMEGNAGNSGTTGNTTNSGTTGNTTNSGTTGNTTNSGTNGNATNGGTTGKSTSNSGTTGKNTTNNGTTGNKNADSGSQSSTGGAMNEKDEDSVTGALGDSARSLGKGIGNAIEDIGDAFDDLSKDR